MEFRESTQEDFDYLADHSVSRGIQKQCPEQQEFVYSLVHEDVVLGIGGFMLINKTTAWCWCDFSTDAGSHILTAYRTMRDWIEVFCKEHGIVRLQAYVECDFTQAISMVQHLGFKKECIMERFMGDKDAFMYVRIL